MKKMIILGSCLVAGAVIYGFVDYAHTDKKALHRMYHDEPAVSQAPPANQTITADAQKAVAPPPALPAKQSIKPPRPKRLFLKEYSRASLEKRYIVKDTAALTH